MKCYCNVQCYVTLTMKLVGIVARGVGNLPTNFGVSRRIRSRLIAATLLRLYVYQVLTS